MNDFIWIFWIVAGVLFMLAEIFTVGFVVFWFGIGAIIAAFAALLGFGYPFQFLLFFVVSTLLTIASRTILFRYLPLGRETEIKTGVEALPGKIGKVVTQSSGALNKGEVQVFGSVWKACPVDQSKPLELGEAVVVDRVEGTTVYVKRLEAESTKLTWRG
ncbi:MAG: NfeD family protein [Pyrinomonadaceae bacterium]